VVVVVVVMPRGPEDGMVELVVVVLGGSRIVIAALDRLLITHRHWQQAAVEVAVPTSIVP
jgi:hypothetical protein